MDDSEKSQPLVQAVSSCCKKEMIEKLKALGNELPAATQLANLQTNNVFNNVFSEPGP